MILLDYLLHKYAMWEVSIAKILVFCLQAGKSKNPTPIVQQKSQGAVYFVYVLYTKT